MDSLSQLALGAAVGVGVMGRRVPVWQAALWGGVCGTLPDLDAFIDHGDAIRNMTMHRGETHALFYQTLAAPLIAWPISKLHPGDGATFRRWWLAVWLALVTHALLDGMTIYGTQLALPFSNHPFFVGSIFIIDPHYTLLVIIGIGIAFARRDDRGLAWNHIGLALSTLYLAWSFAAQLHVERLARAELAAQQIESERVVVGPVAFNTLLWRVLAMTPDGYVEGFHSLLDDTRAIRFDAFPRDTALYDALRELWPVARIAWFSQGFFKVSEVGGQALVTDLRMGREPGYTFTFVVATRDGAGFTPVKPAQVGGRTDARSTLAWWWRRSFGNDLPSPR
jgi:inner membrane protein